MMDLLHVNVILGTSWIVMYICSGKFFHLNLLFSQKDQGIFQQNICLKKNTSILHYNRINILLVKTEMF